MKAVLGRRTMKVRILSLEWKSEKVMDDESGDDNRDELTSEWGGESRHDWWGWRKESGSWFHRRGDAYLNERSVIFSEEMVGGWERVTTDEDWVLWGGLNRDKIVKTDRLSGCKNFVGKKKKFIFDAFRYLKLVERFENGSDMWGFRSLNNSTCKRVMDLFGAG